MSDAVLPVSHVNVSADDDELVVTWRGGSDATSAFVSDDPDDAGTDVRPPDELGRIVLSRTPWRQYIHLFEPEHGFVVAAERRLWMDGPQNFRDIGGYPTSDGTYTRWGQVFRSDGLDGLSDEDHARLLALGISTVFDLRSEGEAAQSPDRLPEGVDHIHMPMSSDVAQQRNMLQRIIDGDMAKFDQFDMAAGYLRMLAGFPDYIARVIGAVAEGQRILFHCTAGKDRTGILAMTLLGLAGVSEPYLLDDYEITSRYRRSEGGSWFADQIRSAGYEPSDFATMWQSPRPVMAITLEGLREQWGDHQQYVRAIGVDDDVADRARTALRTLT